MTSSAASYTLISECNNSYRADELQLAEKAVRIKNHKIYRNTNPNNRSTPDKTRYKNQSSKS